MSDILNTYPVFERNQVLTGKQLNNLVNYLDQQNRLTRAKLIGMGVVCGLEIDYDASENEITISKGTGITSEGYLINLGECVCVKYRPYTLPVGTIYEPFVDSNNVQDIVLHELLTANAQDKLVDQTLDNVSFLSDKVVLLFIESFDKDLKSCLGKGCDELGKERILTLRKLLINKEDLETIWNRTNTGKLDAVFPEKFDLPVVNMPRVLFDPDKTHAKDYTDFSQNYAKTILPVINTIVDALSETYDIYRPLLFKSYDEENPFKNNPITDKLALLLNFLNDSDATFASYLGIQYVYDLFQDLILAYNEFRNSAFDLMSECCPDISRFPKHLMLGEAIPATLTPCENSEYRHYFIQPPVYNLQKLLVRRTISLHNRIVLMLESFDLNRVNSIDKDDFPIRITPSLEKKTPLSLRSVPWYYDLNLVSSYSTLKTLKDYWNFDVMRKCPVETAGLVLNYDDQSDDLTSAQNKLLTPLSYDIKDYSFLRIEGYIGTDYQLALNKINHLKARFNLPFNMVALQLDTDTDTLALDYSCGFEDIQEEFNILKSSFCGFANDLKEIYLFVKENQDQLFEDETRGDELDKYFEKISKIIEILRKMCGAMPDCINKFDFDEFQKTYKSLLVNIINFVLVDMELLKNISFQNEDGEAQIPLINGIIQRLFPVAHKIIDLIFYNRFLRLYYSFKRREFYLRKETSVFSSFIRKHPGVDYQAGVPKGGTFILVYINSEENGVIADFSLPYLCCGIDNCVPMCDDADSGFVFKTPPFARPDYAITPINTKVEIDVMRNDFHLFGGDFIIKSDKISKFGGRIKQLSATGPLMYKPKKGYSGKDTFTYTLTNTRTNNSDEATVTIVVKKAEEEIQACYSVAILQCWGEEAVTETLSIRKIQIPVGADIYEVLLNELRKTGGFTVNEIRYNVLEIKDRRVALLNCIGITFDADTSYDQLEELILQYQKDNCGAQ